MNRIKMNKGNDSLLIHPSKVDEMKTKGWEEAEPGPILTAGYTPSQESIEIEASEGVDHGDIDSSDD